MSLTKIPNNQALFAFALLAFFAGILIYLARLGDFSKTAFIENGPSFFHAMAMGFAIGGLWTDKPYARLVLNAVWVCCACLLEIFQLHIVASHLRLTYGTFDINDMYSTIIGSVIGAIGTTQFLKFRRGRD